VKVGFPYGFLFSLLLHERRERVVHSRDLGGENFRRGHNGLLRIKNKKWIYLRTSNGPGFGFARATT
jgi:hypothetical protein